MGLFGRRRRVGDAGIPGTARVVEVDTEDFWRATPDNDHFHLAEIGLGHKGGLLDAGEAEAARARVSGPADA